MVRHAYRVGGKVALVFVLLFASLATGTATVRPAQAGAYEPYIGEIQLFAYDKVPDGWMFAAGQTLRIDSHELLFRLIGSTYGGDGFNTFALPNLTSAEVPDGTAYYISTKGSVPSADGAYVNSLRGEVRLFPYPFTPKGWIRLNGSRLSKQANMEFYNTIAASVSADATSFTLPTIASPLPDTPIFFAVSMFSGIQQSGNVIEQGTGSEFFGEVIGFLAPMQTSWDAADGRIVPIDESRQALHFLFGKRFGGDGVTNFGMPDLSGNSQKFSYYIVNEGVFPTLEDAGIPRGVVTNTSHTTLKDQKLQLDLWELMQPYDPAYMGIAVRTQPKHGTVKITGRTFEYMPNSGYTGTDTFTTRIYNSQGFSDVFGNVTISVNPNAPPSVSGVVDGTAYSSAVTPTFTEGTAKLNGVDFTSGTAITAEGSYTLAVQNTFGTTTVRFTIDLTAPEVGGVTEGGRYTQPPTLTFDEGTALLNGQGVTSGTKITDEGDYTLIVTNEANQSTTVRFRYYAPRQLDFDSTGGTSVSSQSLYRGDLASEPAPPTRTGYTFTGWYKDRALTQPFDFANTPVTANVTLYAGWTLQSYPVHFDSGGGTAIQNQSIAYGGTIVEPQPPSRTGYRFEGWYTDAARTQKFSFVSPIHEAITLYAGWKAERYTVEFKSGGGTSVADQVLDYGSFASAPPTPERTGYLFTGWYTDANLSEPYPFDSSAIHGDLVLYAGWDRIMYTASFRTHGGSIIDQASVGYGDQLTPPTDPTPGQEGLSFAGWFADEGYTRPFDFSTPIVTDVELHAKWAQRVQRIVFDTTGGTPIAEQQAAYGDRLSRPADPTKIGYDFVGWYADALHQQPFDFAATAVTADLVLYADWTPSIYRVEFDSTGGTVVAEQQAAYGEMLARPTDPARTGYRFADWYRDEAYRQLFDFASISITENLKLYAKWTPILYRLLFDTEGGSPVAEQQAKYGEVWTAPADPTRTGYTFDGWYTDAAHTQRFVFEQSPVTADQQVYAGWTLNSPPNPGNPNNPTNPSNPTNPTNPSDPVTPTDPNGPSTPSNPGGTSPTTGTFPASGEAVGANASGSGGQTAANSAEGRLVLPARQGGEVRLGSELRLQIPAGTLQQSAEIQASVRTTPTTVSEPNLRLVSSVYELKKNTSQGFDRPLTLTLRFDASSMKVGEKPAIFYQNNVGEPWVRVEGGVLNGNEISAEIQHFTFFAVMAVQDSNASDASAGKTRFADLERHWAAADIRQAVESGIVTGYADGSFKPDARITRAEFTVMLLRALAPRTSDSNLEEISLPFTDGDSIGVWAKADIARAYALGWVKGNGSGKFRPDAIISRAEMAVMIAEAASLQGSGTSPASFADTASMPTWAASAAAAVQQAGLMNGRGGNRFEPLATATRAEAASVLLRVLSN